LYFATDGAIMLMPPEPYDRIEFGPDRRLLTIILWKSASRAIQFFLGGIAIIG
jgi:hypothetical protein